ncbi:MAG: hypothetical protein BMS9Abin29_1540 [Gemmatimonadota bacterium]|nr:MAG: hypothetical protein BMS9Abin29_1540 [Gemmatimonadota bacterium]
MARGGKKGREGAASSVVHAPPAGAEIPRWVPSVLYGVVTLFLFRSFVFSDEMLVGTDTLSLGYMAREFYANALKQGTFPLWNPIILGGTPFLESLAGGDSLYPPSVILLLLMSTYRALGWKLVLHVFLAGLFMFGWTRSLGRSRAAALLAGLAYLLAPFMVTLVYPGQDGKIFVTALTPLMFWVTERSLVRRSLLPLAGISLVVGLVILTTHFQMAYFLFGAVGVYTAFRCVQIARGHDVGEGKGGARPAATRFAAFLAASVVGAGIGAVQLLPAVDYVTAHSRRTSTTVRASDEGSIAYSSSWSLHPEEVMSLVVPEFVGSTQGDAAWANGTYWGRNPIKYNHEYAGVVVLLLAGLSFFGAPRKGLRLFLVGIAGVALLFALGQHTPIWRLFYEVVPGISLFRAPSQAIFLFGFVAATLMAFGVDRVLELARSHAPDAWRSPMRYLWIGLGLLAVLTGAAAVGVLTSAWTAVLYPDMLPGRSQALARLVPFIVRGLFIVTALCGAAVGAVWAHRSGLLPRMALVVALASLVLVDLLRVDAPFIQTMDFERFGTPDPNVRALVDRQAREQPFRVLSMAGGTGQDVTPGQFGLELAGGHHPNDLARYRELIGMVGSGIPVNLLFNANVLRILNVRYLIWPVALGTPEDQSLPPATLENLQPISQTTLRGQPYETVYSFAGLPRARLVSEAIVVPDDQAVAFIMSDDFDPVNQVVLPELPPTPLGPGPVEGEVEWVSRGVNEQELRVRADRPALLVIADNWFPAWHARVNGEAAPVLRADHTLRAIPVPSGESTVSVYYSSGQLRTGLWVTVLSSLLVLGAAVVSYVRGRKPPLEGVA